MQSLDKNSEFETPHQISREIIGAPTESFNGAPLFI